MTDWKKKGSARIIAYLWSSSLAQAVGEGTASAHLKAVGDLFVNSGSFFEKVLHLLDIVLR
jgi:hypothetical protein